MRERRSWKGVLSIDALLNVPSFLHSVNTHTHTHSLREREKQRQKPDNKLQTLNRAGDYSHYQTALPVST